MISRSKPVLYFRHVVMAALTMSASVASAQDQALAPGGQVNPVGVTATYACSAGEAREIALRFVEFKGGEFQIEEQQGNATANGLSRYPWQLATATLYRQRVTARGATKFRRLRGSLRTLQELVPGGVISAEYAEAPLDGAAPPLEWQYQVTVGQRAVSFAPGGLGEVEIVQIEERRSRYVDGQGRPLTIANAARGFDRREIARIAYAPSLGVPIRIERKRDGSITEACSLSSYQRL